MNKKTKAYIMFHTVEEGKNMDREKLNLCIYNVVYKDGWIKKGICWIVIGAGFLVPVIAVIRLVLQK